MKAYVNNGLHIPHIMYRKNWRKPELLHTSVLDDSKSNITEQTLQRTRGPGLRHCPHRSGWLLPTQGQWSDWRHYDMWSTAVSFANAWCNFHHFIPSSFSNMHLSIAPESHIHPRLSSRNQVRPIFFSVRKHKKSWLISFNFLFNTKIQNGKKKQKKKICQHCLKRWSPFISEDRLG